MRSYGRGSMKRFRRGRNRFSGNRGEKPLLMAGEGNSVRIAFIDCGHGLQAKLASLGIVNGREIRIIRNRGGGPLVIKAMNGRIILGRGMANKISVN